MIFIIFNLVKNQNLTKIFQDLLKIKKLFEEKLNSCDEKLESFFKLYQDQKGIEDLSTTKIKSLEFDLKRQFTLREALELENERLGQENQALLEKTIKLERLNLEIQKKNAEISVLENKMQQANRTIDELKQKIAKIEGEKGRLNENYKLLIEFNKKSNEVII